MKTNGDSRLKYPIYVFVNTQVNYVGVYLCMQTHAYTFSCKEKKHHDKALHVKMTICLLFWLGVQSTFVLFPQQITLFTHQTPTHTMELRKYMIEHTFIMSPLY